MRHSELLKHYQKKDIASELIRISNDKEVGIMLRSGGYAKRPEILQMPGDVLRFVKLGATSFHVSEERWNNPLQLNPNLTPNELNNLRKGFDLIFDIDCKHLEWSKICAELLIKAIKWHDISSVSVKFSGGTGFHIGMPHEALQGIKKNTAFPETPRIVAEYLKEFIKPHLSDKLIEFEQDIKKIAKKADKKPSELLVDNQLDPYQLMEIDTVLISSRHLFRAPYSLNEKKWLVSVPLKEKDIQGFTTDQAKIDNIDSIHNWFLNTKHTTQGEASQLLTQALDWKIKELNKNEPEKREIIEIEGKVPLEACPPCMKLILNGIQDGKKRSIFVLLNFLKNCNWSIQEIEQKMYEWNQKNPQPLKKGYIISQLNYFKRNPSKVPPPPNCNNKAYYRDFNVCKPDFICTKIRNPLSYVRFKTRQKS